MLSQTIRSSRYSVVRLARQQASSTRRTFSVGALRQADLVQDMYLNQLKNYKVPAVKASDSEGQVHKFSPPKPPQSPEQANESDVKSYESQSVETEMQASGGEHSASENDWFEEDDFAEDEKDSHH